MILFHVFALKQNCPHNDYFSLWDVVQEAGKEPPFMASLFQFDITTVIVLLLGV